MRTILALTFLLFFSASAVAQNKITVVNPDGTKTSIDIGASPIDSQEPVAAPKDKPVNLRLKPETASPAAPKPTKKAAPKKKTVVKEPAAQQTSVKKEAAQPKKKPSVPQEKSKKKAETKAQKRTAKKPERKPESKTGKGAGKKSAKQQTPEVSAAAPKAPRPSVSLSAQTLGPNMTADDAIRIALDVAPPSRSVHAVPANYKGLHVYQVLFATEEGEQSVFVDRETGRIVK